MFAHLIRALPAAVAACVLPGYFWALVLRPRSGLGERLIYSAALSMASVPAVAVILARIAGTGIELWVAVASVAIVLGSGALVRWRKGPAPGTASPVLPRPALVRDPLTLTVLAGALVLAFGSMLDPHLPGLSLLIITAGLVIAGALAAWRSPTPTDADPIPGDARSSPGEPGPDPALAGSNARQPEPPAGHAGSGPRQAESQPRQAGPSRLTQAGSQPGQADHPTPTAGGSRAGLADPTPGTGGSWPGRTGSRGRWLPDMVLAVVLVLTGFRAYDGVVRHDWPFLRGGDQFSHAVMAEQMLWHGSYGTYLVYPPGFSALTAVICRFAALPPLALFPVLAPALLVVTTAGAYALAARLWGWEYGIAAAVLSGWVLTGSYAGFAEGRYPDLVSAYFLLVMTVTALISVYETPSVRSGALATVIGASVVLYHSVATLYLAALLALVALISLPYLLYARRAGTAQAQRQQVPAVTQQARAIVLTLTGVAVLSACYAAYIYNIARALTRHSAASTAVTIVIGSQPAPGPRHVLTQLAPPIIWLGVLGLAAMVAGLRHLARPAQVLTVLTVGLWCLLMYAGSRTALDGFPQRFERDLGAPLSVTGALGLGLVLSSLAAWRPSALVRSGTDRGSSPPRAPSGNWQRGLVPALTAAASFLVAAMVVVQAAHNLTTGARGGREVLTRPVAAAGAWLARHNTGGNIISTPYLNPGVSNRAVLAMGGYTGLQSYSPRRIAHPRSLPPAGRKPLLDSRHVLLHPGTCQAATILARDDIRYVVLYKFGTGADLAAFRASPHRYRRVFENASVIIYATTPTPCG